MKQRALLICFVSLFVEDMYNQPKKWKDRI